MARAHKPRSGSLAYYPKVRAKKHMAVFNTYPAIESEGSKPINYFGYKAGMFQVMGKNAREKSNNFGQTSAIPSTIIECPPIKIIGVRVYGKGTYGIRVLGETTIEKPGKNLRKKITAFKVKGKKRKEEKKYSNFEELEKLKEKTLKVVLIGEVQPGMTGIGKKKADLGELNLTGTIDEQFAFAKSKLGKEMRVNEAFADQDFLDVKAVDKGKGFQGPVKRAGVKIQRPKAKKHRSVGSIGPWHPATVMWTVARPGQLGYQTRTEYNRRVLTVQTNSKPISIEGGFPNYGVIKSDYVIVTGSVPGPVKRPIALRHAIRKAQASLAKYSDLNFPLEVQEEVPVKEEKKEEKETKEEKPQKAEEKEEKKEVKEAKKEEKKENKKEVEKK